MHILEACKNDFSHLESIFSSPPFLKPSMASTDGQEVINLNIGSPILHSNMSPCYFLFPHLIVFSHADDIQIDELVTISSSSSEKIKNDGKGLSVVS